MSKVQVILDGIKALTALELSELVKEIETTFGVSAAAPVMAAGFAMPGGEAKPAAEEKTEFTIKMTDSGADKIKVIKELRNIISGLGLKEAKEMTEPGSLPVVVKEAVKKDEAEKIKKQLEDAGAKVQLA